MSYRRLIFPFLLLAMMSVSGAPAGAARVSAAVAGAGGAPLEDAVVTLMPTDGGGPAMKPGEGVVDQVKLEFIPYVTVITAGSKISFPNSDRVRHHVYSFSPSKTFELPLYAGAAAPAVLFDKPGVVPLGCNIHDWMIAYDYVSATPWVAKTGKDGRATLEGVPPGSYLAKVWHPRQTGAEEATRKRIEVTGADQSLSWMLELKPKFRINRRSGDAGFGY